MNYEIRAEIPDDREGVTTLVRFEAPTFTQAWMEAERMKAMGWQVLSAPVQVKFPTFDLSSAA